jgi:hypothetical protein
MKKFLLAVLVTMLSIVWIPQTKAYVTLDQTFEDLDYSGWDLIAVQEAISSFDVFPGQQQISILINDTTEYMVLSYDTLTSGINLIFDETVYFVDLETITTLEDVSDISLGLTINLVLDEIGSTSSLGGNILDLEIFETLDFTTLQRVEFMFYFQGYTDVGTIDYVPDDFYDTNIAVKYSGASVRFEYYELGEENPYIMHRYNWPVSERQPVNEPNGYTFIGWQTKNKVNLDNEDFNGSTVFDDDYLTFESKWISMPLYALYESDEDETFIIGGVDGFQSGSNIVSEFPANMPPFLVSILSAFNLDSNIGYTIVYFISTIGLLLFMVFKGLSKMVLLITYVTLHVLWIFFGVLPFWAIITMTLIFVTILIFDKRGSPNEA